MTGLGLSHPTQAGAGHDAPQRARFVVVGLVQGVGFRPFVARLATEVGLTGWCSNTDVSVVVEAVGAAAALQEFHIRLVADAPVLARVLHLRREDLPVGEPEPSFQIVNSSPGAGGRTLVAPDTAVCDDCLADLRDPANRRYRHPFVTCTNCGPRFTITLDLPYDRPTTTMADFAMCTACRAEYSDPADRRYHAQPICCHDCGPRLRLYDADRTPLHVSTEEALRIVRADLAAGRIVAVKGVGGVHLACDATDPRAVARLRARKRRPHKPFAVMTADLEAAAGVVELSAASREMLSGPARPIVLLPRLPDAQVADEVAPGLDELGVMLPYTPLHHLLFDPPPQADLTAAPAGPGVLVMTSGNASGEPLCHTDDDALSRLHSIVDRFLLHDRVIHLPCDDSVVTIDDGHELPVRRSRGYAPLPIALSPDGGTRQGADRQTVGGQCLDTECLVELGNAEQCLDTECLVEPGNAEQRHDEPGNAEQRHDKQRHDKQGVGTAGPDARPGHTGGGGLQPTPTVLAAGAELKNTFTLARDGLAFVSGHLGDLAGLRSRRCYDDAIAQALQFHRRAPSLIVADRHPGYASRTRAEQMAEQFGVDLVEVQHHHAHLASLAAEHGRLTRPLLGLVFDGTGYGCDSTIWGGELLLLCDGGVRAERLGHLGLLPLPGADAAVRNPVRAAAAAMIATGVRIRPESPVAQAITAQELATISAMVGSGTGCPTTSSVGRLFDVVSSMLGVRHRISYEAQAAIELETLARRWTGPLPPLRLPVVDGLLQPGELLAGLDERLADGARVEALAAAFHHALAEGAADLAAHACHRHGLSTVGLTGGVFVNRVLLHHLRASLHRRGLDVLTHRLVPPNDGGLSLGQAAIGTRLLARSHRQGG